MTELQVGCKIGDKMLDHIINLKHQFPENLCCVDGLCCEGCECECCNEDGNNTMGDCDCMMSDDEYSEYLENREQMKKLDEKFRKHQRNCKECQL